MKLLYLETCRQNFKTHSSLKNLSRLVGGQNVWAKANS
jgi:hypothetical protein